jgi:hypothetical protein
MGGETDLGKLLASMQPELQPHAHVFVTVPEGFALPLGVEPVMVFREREGTTLILREDQANGADLAGTFRCRMITLTVHSALEGVGFLAAITARLSASGIGSNPVSAFYHDHLFVPADRADDAMRVLRELSAEGAVRVSMP